MRAVAKVVDPQFVNNLQDPNILYIKPLLTTG